MDTAGTGRPRSRSRRPTAPPETDPSDDAPQRPLLSFPLPGQAPARLYIPDDRSLEAEPADCWGTGDEYCRSSTAHSTPRVLSRTPAATPSRSVCGDNFFGSYYHPNYMANTKSSEEKQLRWHSAPKQRPEPAGGGRSNQKRVSWNELMESRSSQSGARMQRSCSRVREAINFKNAVMGKLHRSGEFGRDQAERDHYHYHNHRRTF